MRLRNVATHSAGGVGTFGRRYPVGGVSGLVLLTIIILALAASAVAPYHPTDDADFLSRNKEPSQTYVLGTDSIGRDMLSRVIHGARISLFVAFMAVLLGDGVGLIWGVATGYLGGRFDIYSQRFLELMMSLPTIILAMLLLLWLGAGILPVIIAIAITRVPLTVRVIRSVALSVRETAFIEAARAIGASNLRIMALHVTPQVLAPWLVLATAHLGAVVVLEASLGFLGVGIPPPTPTWGNMLGGEVAERLVPRWWLVIYPGLAITITVLAINLFGDAMRDRLDPKLRGRGGN
jgi:ABC-type dipeptide/oligopeptide/nickel transport system permease subunit